MLPLQRKKTSQKQTKIMHYDTFVSPNWCVCACKVASVVSDWGWVERWGSETPSMKKAYYFVVCSQVRNTQGI